MQHLKNLIFDVGGVLLEYRWTAALTDIGETKEEARRIAAEIVNSPLWSRMDAGNVTAEGMIEALSKKYPADAEQITWFLHHPDHLVVTRPEIWEKVSRLRGQGYRIYLLSNYSRELWKAHVLPQPFYRELDGCVVSYEENALKPSAEIYHILLDRYQLKPEESVFFDDRPENTLAAKQCGIAGITVISRDFLNRTLDALLSEGPVALENLEKAQPIEVGIKGHGKRKVTEDLLAANVGSGLVRVFATPMMIAGIENTAASSVAPFLPEGKTTVGTRIDVTHEAPTPEGMLVYFDTQLTGISANGKILTFRVTASDDTGIIGRGTHERAIISKDRFEQKAAAKAETVRNRQEENS